MNIRNILSKIRDLLRQGNDLECSELLQNAIQGDELVLKAFLNSNDLWGGAGSIADQALIDDKDLRKELEALLIDLGKLQEKNGIINPRTRSWVNAFVLWKEKHEQSAE